MDFNIFAAELTGAYELFSAALVGRYLSVLSAAGSPAPANYVRQFSGMARDLVTQFAITADTRINQYVANIDSGADVSARARHLKRSLSAISVKNASDLMRQLRAGSNNLKSLLADATGATGMLLQRRLASPQLKSVDSAGRLWDSTKLVRFMVRDFAYQCQIDAQAANLAVMSDLAQVVYPDDAHAGYGLVVSLTGATPDKPTLASIRTTVFHPNSSATLRHV